MELIAEDTESVTIKMSRRPEYANLFAILRTFSTDLESDPCGVDLEWLMISKEDARAVLNDFFKMDEALV